MSQGKALIKKKTNIQTFGQTIPIEVIYYSNVTSIGIVGPNVVKFLHLFEDTISYFLYKLYKVILLFCTL